MYMQVMNAPLMIIISFKFKKIPARDKIKIELHKNQGRMWFLSNFQYTFRVLSSLRQDLIDTRKLHEKEIN